MLGLPPPGFNLRPIVRTVILEDQITPLRRQVFETGIEGLKELFRFLTRALTLLHLAWCFEAERSSQTAMAE